MMQENTETQGSSQPEKEAVKTQAKGLFRSLRDFVAKITDIRTGADVDKTIERIKHDIEIKGSNVWTLGASIFIASIGLNVNSVPVIIGAMLISPLLAPILGIGLGVGTNDWETLLRSLRSFAVAVIVSVLVSCIYFLITPLGEVQSELIARTRPTLLDVLIAVCGGLAGIVAFTRKEFNNVVPGVAIATALMPPLCTAGYGLANLNFQFFFGAMYLFVINSVFICLSTVLILKFLRFPSVSWVDPVRERRVRRYMLFFVLLVVVPSTYTFWNIIQEERLRTKISRYVYDEIENNKVIFGDSRMVDWKVSKKDSIQLVEVILVGNIVPPRVEGELNRKLKERGIENTRIDLIQDKDYTQEISGKLTEEVRTGIIEDIYRKNAEALENRNMRIKLLENEIVRLRKDSIPFNIIKSMVKELHPNIEQFAYAPAVRTDFAHRQDTIPTFFIKWSRKEPAYLARKKQAELSVVLRHQLNADTVQVLNY